MKSREEIEHTLKAALASGESKIEEMRAKLAAAGDDASDDAKVALAEAEKMWEDGKVKFDQLSQASDEKFAELRADAEANWDEISDRLESGWASVSEKFKGFFS